MDDTIDRQQVGGRIGHALDRVEIIYLRILRASVLVVATILIIIAIGYAGVNLVKVMRSPASVVEAPVTVEAADLIPADGKSVVDTSAKDREDQLNLQRRTYYDGFVKRYFALYQRSFAPFKRADDKALSLGEFDDLTIDSGGRLDAIRRGDLDFARDKTDLTALLTTMGNAAKDAKTIARLNRYKTATKSRIATHVRRTRTETRRGWDMYATSCTGWYEPPIGCPATRRVEIPYMEKVYEMRFPTDVEAPGKVFKGYQDRFFTLLNERRASSAATAESARNTIIAGQYQGRAGLVTALAIGGGFVILMFFFLLIAIERHQRRLTAAVR